MCAVLFDGPVGEQTLPEVGSLMVLGAEEINLLEKVHQIIRASPGKAEGLFERFRQILKEEKKEEVICNQCPGFNHRDEWDATQMRSSPPSHDTGSVTKRGIGSRRRVAKKKEASKKKKVARNKDRQNMKSRKVERKQTGVEKPRKLGKKEKLKENKKHMKLKKASQKKKRKKNKNLNNCTSLWAELTNVGLGVATTIRKQVMDIDLVIKDNSLAGKFHKKQ